MGGLSMVQGSSQQKRVRVSPSIFVRVAHNGPIVIPIVCQPADIDKWKHLLANVEAIINATATYSPEEPVKLLNLVTEAVKAVRPAYATRFIYVETSGGTILLNSPLPPTCAPPTNTFPSSMPRGPRNTRSCWTREKNCLFDRLRMPTRSSI